MSETLIETVEVKEEPIVAANPFSESTWKSEPVAEVKDPVIKEKDEQIKEDNPTVTKPDEPEKIPGATPHPIQDRPDEVKEDVKPVEKQVAAPEPIKFANQESEKVFNLLKEGKHEDVYNILHEQNLLASVDKMSPAEAIKLDLQYKNKDFSKDDINDLFSERYVYPEKPIQDLEDDNEFAEKIAKYEKEVQKIDNRIKRDAKPAIAELQKLRQEIVIPDIQKTTPAEVAPTQEELEAQRKETELFFKTVDENVQNFKGYNATFKDEEVEIKVGYSLSADEKKELQPIVALAGTDAGAFLQKLGWLDAEGNLNTTKLTEDIPLILSRDKVLSKLVSETGEKRHAASVKSIKNIDYTGDRNNGEIIGNQPELQKQLVNHFFSQ